LSMSIGDRQSCTHILSLTFISNHS
jgi:hypothetical protein